jgi:hypothetical protein
MPNRKVRAHAATNVSVMNAATIIPITIDASNTMPSPLFAYEAAGFEASLQSQK